MYKRKSLYYLLNHDLQGRIYQISKNSTYRLYMVMEEQFRLVEN